MSPGPSCVLNGFSPFHGLQQRLSLCLFGNAVEVKESAAGVLWCEHVFCGGAAVTAVYQWGEVGRGQFAAVKGASVPRGDSTHNHPSNCQCYWPPRGRV